ncbi:MAG: tRNA (N6-isopentenyl adenosine(37)-C2)-methylthiotransferase MiaB, partial [Ghiorsea sp.]|nr:tRNA (N6-isopentenyl adenosine(37)-C2)-methylthiotransferase MiaB [Ghiorsea sp.]
EIDMPEIEKFDHLPKPKVEGLTGYVTIMEGCDKFCTFCIVPYTRGAEISRPPEDILEECRQLIEAGAKDISLLGQNVNAYQCENANGEAVGFADLLHLVGDLEGMQRLRFSTSHPMEMTTELCEAFAEIPTLMPYLHLPVQSGSNEILKAMHRGHKREDYFKAIDELRLFTPDIALSSDFIVGFPGETDEDFEMTLDLVRKVGYDSAFSFKYSPRPGTPAAKAEDDVPEDVKDERLQRLLALLREQSRERMEQQVGKTTQVLIESKGKNEGDLQGRTPDFRIVHLQGNPRLIGQTMAVKITAAYNMSLRGELIIEN